MRVSLLPFNKENPYQKILKSNLERQGIEVLANDLTQSDILHIHWNDKFLRFRKQKPFVWTCHNIFPHIYNNNPPASYVADQWNFLKKVDHIIFHSYSAREELMKYYRYPEAKTTVIPHLSYRGWYPNKVTKEEARLKLQISSEKVFLFFGYIKPYKGVLELIQSFKRVKGDATLLLVGKPHRISVFEIMRMIDDDERIKLFPAFIEDQDVQFYLNAADYMVLPYSHIYTSGAFYLAQDFGLPVISSINPFFNEVVKYGVKTNDFQSTMQAIVGEKLEIESEVYSPDNNSIAKQHIEVYNKVC